MIEFRGVGKRFPDGTVGLDSLTLTAREGEITVLVGPSGCGKTTSLRTVNRMVEPTSGSVHLDGREATYAGEVLAPAAPPGTSAALLVRALHDAGAAGADVLHVTGTGAGLAGWPRASDR